MCQIGCSVFIILTLAKVCRTAAFAVINEMIYINSTGSFLFISISIIAVILVYIIFFLLPASYEPSRTQGKLNRIISIVFGEDRSRSSEFNRS
jgi:hypothetical protein